MSAPAQMPQMQQGPPTTNLDSLVAALGNAAERAAEKGAGTQDGAQAKDFGSAALAYTQALMLIMAPHVPPPPGGAPGQQPGT